MTGFSPRKSAITIYIMSGVKNHPDLIKKLGKTKTSVGCVYINKLEDVDLDVLKQLIKNSVVDIKGK